MYRADPEDQTRLIVTNMALPFNAKAQEVLRCVWCNDKMALLSFIPSYCMYTYGRP